MLENIRLALRGIWSHKLRSILTMLGVIIGIASIIAIVSIVEGTNKKLETSLIGAGNNVTTVQVMQDGWAYEFEYNGVPEGIPQVNDESIERIKGIEGVVNAAKYLQRQGWNVVYYGDATLSNTFIRGIGDGYFQTLGYSLILGRNFAEDEFNSGKKVTVIDENAMDALFNGEDPVGKVIEIQQEPYIVIGVVKDENKEEKEYESITDYYMYGGTQTQSNVYIPAGTWPIIYQYDEPESVAIKVEETKMMQSVAESAAEILNERVSGDYQYGAQTGDSMEELETLTNAIQLMLVGIASLSLLVGGIGVMNIMLVSVTERTSEIGLKKALGAKRRVILWQFLTESAVLTSVGGVLGIILGIILAKVISIVTGLPFGISVTWIIISVLFSMGIGILFGAMPASKASKLSPIDALRRE